MINIENDSDFSCRLREVIGKGSIASFAKSSGLSANTMHAYLAGTSKPGLDALVAMAEAADVTVQWLATGEAPEPAPPVDEERLEIVIRVILEEALDLAPKTAQKVARAVSLAYEMTGEDADDESVQKRTLRVVGGM